jgi:hypothetical protein
MPDDRFQINKQLQETMMKHAESIAKIYEPMLRLQNFPALQELQETIQGFSKVVEEIALENQETMRRFIEVNNHPGLKAFSEQMQLMNEQFTAKFNIDYSFTSHFSELLSTIDWESIPNQDFLVGMDRIKERDFYDEIESKIKRENTGYSGKQYIYIHVANLVIQIMTIYFLLQAHFDVTNKQILSESKQTNILLKKIEGHLANTDSLDEASITNTDLFLEVKKEAPLRLYPDSSSDSILTVLPGQFLDLLNDSKRWYKVQFVNYENGDYGIGWIYKGHVEEIRGER